MVYQFTRRKAELAYRENWVWVPKSAVNVRTLKSHLELRTDVDVLTLWRETRDHVLVPREYPGLPALTMVDRTPQFTRVDFDDLVVPRNDKQYQAWEALKAAKNGVLQLACGSGKTVLACKRIAWGRVPTLVVVNQGALLEQWLEELQRFLGLRPDQIGRIQGDVCDWQKPVTLAMIQTLAQRHDKWPLEMRRWFGLCIVDEVHHLSAESFLRTAPLCFGDRIGLTATPERTDGLEFAYFAHLGPVFYTDMTQDLRPSIFFQRLLTQVDMSAKSVNDRTGEFNISKFRKHLVRLPERNQWIAEHVRRARDKGRRVVVLGHIKEGLDALKELLPEAAIVTGDIKNLKRRLEIFRQHELVLATMDIAKESLNVPAIDTVFFTTPFRAWGALIQGMGRALRTFVGKQPPVIVLFEDSRVGPAKGMMRKLKSSLVLNGYSPVTVEPGQ